MSEGTEPKSSVTVRIAGEEYTIRSSAEADYTRSCAHLVDERIRDVRKRSGLLEPEKIAILAALAITDELFQAQAALGEARDGFAAAAHDLTERLEATLS